MKQKKQMDKLFKYGGIIYFDFTKAKGSKLCHWNIGMPLIHNLDNWKISFWRWNLQVDLWLDKQTWILQQTLRATEWKENTLRKRMKKPGNILWFPSFQVHLPSFCGQSLIQQHKGSGLWKLHPAILQDLQSAHLAEQSNSIDN